MNAPIAIFFTLQDFLLIALVIGMVAFAIALFRWLWNTTMPQVFDIKPITYWQSLRLLLIAGFLFGGGKYAFDTNPNLKISQLNSKVDKMTHQLDAVAERLARQQQQ